MDACSLEADQAVQALVLRMMMLCPHAEPAVRATDADLQAAVRHAAEQTAPPVAAQTLRIPNAKANAQRGTAQQLAAARHAVELIAQLAVELLIVNMF